MKHPFPVTQPEIEKPGKRYHKTIFYMKQPLSVTQPEIEKPQKGYLGNVPTS